MADSSNTIFSEPSSTPSSSDTDSVDSDPNASDPNASGESHNAPPDPASASGSASGISPDSGPASNDYPTNESTDNPSDGLAQNGSGATPTVLPTPSPQPAALAPTSALDSVGASQQPSALPNHIPPSSLGSKSDNHTKTIIIASSVSGGVALILALAVILFVYRRRFLGRRSATFVNVMPSSARRGSDATWIGPPAGKSYADDKLEGGDRNSNSSLESEATTLADFTASRAKSGAFGRPSHTPKPSLDTIKMQLDPLVPADPFEKPALALVEKSRPSLDKVAARPAALPVKGKRGILNAD
ncbi:hypothetical protein BN946_scf184902.g10 [Trametes cinnabarina]|uniref:Uncharacterized protein n=1 Tax=Pycnoporus cinnabarinus TaxID=5643 RepID=A0A060STL1_PYCCI|nr:hypothetical protein BN946_scf184902.g10 [Trametes cinnabarina]